MCQKFIGKTDLLGMPGSSAEDFDYRRLNDYFQRIRSQDTPSADDADAWQKLLLNTEFLIEEDDRKPATVAGLLLFSANPNRFLPQAGIDAVAYPGKEKDYAAKERLSIRGPMTALLGTDGIFENGLVEQAVEFVRRNTEVAATLADGARREQKWTYPEEAVREAIVNALVHRNYLLSGITVELSVYDDRLEVIFTGRISSLPLQVDYDQWHVRWRCWSYA
jgi:ATP-dependent DNA helicase RecG